MHAHKLTVEYDNGVKEFIKFAVELADNLNRIRCPCIRSGCIDKLRDHLLIYMIEKSYIRWIQHGESTRGDRPIISTDGRCDEREEVDCSEGDQLEDMIHDVEKTLQSLSCSEIELMLN